MNIITVDFESFYSDEFSLTKLTTEAYVRDPRFEVIGVGVKIDSGPSRWVPQPQVAAILKRIPWDKVAVLCHNTAFDGLILSHHYGIRPKFLLDTMSMAKPFHHADVGVSLLKLAAHYECGVKGNEVVQAKGMRFVDFSPEALAAYGSYCCNDCDLTYDLFQKLRSKLPPSELLFIDKVLRTFTEPTLVWDKKLLELHHTDIIRRKQALLSRINTLCGVESLSSNAKFLNVLERLGGRWPLSMMGGDEERYQAYMSRLNDDPDYAPYAFDIPTKMREATPTEQKKGVEGEVEVWALAKKDEEFLALQEIDNEDLQAVIAARLGTKSTIAETRAARMMDAADRGPFPISLQYGAAHTGRLGGGGEKSNPQNFPKAVAASQRDIGFFIMTPDGPTVMVDMRDGVAYTATTSYPAKACTTISIRHALRAPPGHKLVVADASQIEARIVAWNAEQENLVQGFRNKEDIYSDFATSVYGYKVNKKDHPVERFTGKTCVLQLGFGAGHAKLQTTLAIGQGDTKVELALEETKRIVDIYRKEKYPNIPKLWRQHQKAIEAAFMGEEFVFGCRGILRTSKDKIHLPNGMAIHYKNLRRSEKEEGFEYWGKKDGRYQWVRIYSGKACENTTQALARLPISNAWVKLAQKYKVVMQVHDELVCCVPEDQAEQCLADMIREMSTPPSWGLDLPLDAEGDIGDSYADAK